MQVIKRNGDIESFDKKKVQRSLLNSGVSQQSISRVISTIIARNYDSITTEKLYRIIYKLVSKYENKYSASIYSLKSAIMRLGPDGYAFEDYIAKIFIQLGDLVETRKIYESMCITHELDVVGRDFFVECKYHNKGGISSSIKDVLYSHARFLDLKHASKEKGYNFKRLWIITNTRFSDDCLDYGKYWGINLVSWKYDGVNSLSYIIDKNHLYPVTLLPSVSKRAFGILSRNNILLINEVKSVGDSLLKKMGLFDDEIKKIREDCDKIIKVSEGIVKEGEDK